MRIISLDDREFIKFKELIYNEAGIKLSDLKKALVQSRLSKRLRALGLNSYRDYYDYLIDNYTSEKIDFVNAITTNKTDFFREKRHFDFMVNTCLPELDLTKSKSIRIWSAGCSTGEEPYTIAIVLSEYYKDRNKPDMKILASDIDTTVLQKAIEGVYAFERVEEFDVSLLKKYFYRGSGENQGLFKVKNSLREMVFFRRLNLMDETFPMKKKFNIIFCRNVIIYFDKETQKKIIEKLHNYLDDSGYLFIGHSENISNLTDKFKLLGHTIYRKAVQKM